jgi:four helix bundle protein
MAERIDSYKDLHVYQNALDAAMKVFELTKRFPKEEKYSLVDQMRRSSRSVCANIAEAWRKRRYEGAFISKLSDSETEACETQVWIEFAWRCKYLNEEEMKALDGVYDHILAQLVTMIDHPSQWLIKSQRVPKQAESEKR